MSKGRTFAALGLVLPVVVFTVYLIANQTIGMAAGSWKIVSAWAPNPARLNPQEIRINTLVTVDQNGYLLTGRRGLEGVMSRSLASRRHYTLTQNGNGHEYDIIIGGVRDGYMSIISRKYNEVIVLRKVEKK